MANVSFAPCHTWIWSQTIKQVLFIPTGSTGNKNLSRRLFVSKKWTQWVDMTKSFIIQLGNYKYAWSMKQCYSLGKPDTRRSGRRTRKARNAFTSRPWVIRFCKATDINLKYDRTASLSGVGMQQRWFVASHHIHCHRKCKQCFLRINRHVLFCEHCLKCYINNLNRCRFISSDKTWSNWALKHWFLVHLLLTTLACEPFNIASNVEFIKNEAPKVIEWR